MNDIHRGALCRIFSDRSEISAGLRSYASSPLIVLKDFLLLSLAIPGLFALLRPETCTSIQGPATAPEKSLLSTKTIDLGCNCGSSVAEAISIGCKYDALASAWLPAHCRDEALTAEFERAGDGPAGEWTYWADSNHTIELTLDEIASHGGDANFRFQATADWHLHHCLFYWRKQFRARSTGVLVEARYNTERHIVHCIGVALGRRHGKPPHNSESGVVLNSDVVVD